MIPRSVNDLTVEFFSSISGCPVASFTVESATPLQGNTSTVTTVLINFSSPLTFPSRRLYLKFALPLDDTDAHNVSFTRQLFIDAQVYRKEVLFYRQNKQLDMVPPVYYAEIDEPGGVDHFLIVMGEGGEPQNQLSGCSLDISRLIVAQVARFHAQFINSKDCNDPNRNLHDALYFPAHNILNQIIKAEDRSSEGLLEYCLQHFESKFHDFSLVAKAMAMKSGDSITDNLLAIKSRFTDKSIFSDLRLAFSHNFFYPSFRTLIHGDFRLDNILFDPQTDSVKFIDFQAVHYGHPAYDLAQFIVQCHDEHELIFDELLTIYYNTLCETDPSVAQLCSMEDLMVTVRSTVVFQILLLSFHLAPLKSSIDPQTGRLPESFDRFMDLIALINKRALRAYLTL